ncbi:MAG: hypothetical protein P8Y66_12020 [Nitrospirota bacterium]|jgi:hypothetical protein
MNRHALQRRQELNQKKAEAGLVSERFPQVSKIVIQMTYYHRTTFSETDSVLMDRTVNVYPDSPAYFHMRCAATECSGEFDLTPVIRAALRDGKKRAAGKLICPGKGDDLPAKHASIDYEITVRYN